MLWTPTHLMPATAYHMPATAYRGTTSEWQTAQLRQLRAQSQFQRISEGMLAAWR